MPTKHNQDVQRVLAPFAKDEQYFLESVDKAARAESARIANTLMESEAEGGKCELDSDDQGIMALIQAFGMLYNRAILAGWIDGLVLNPDEQLKEHDSLVERERKETPFSD